MLDLPSATSCRISTRGAKAVRRNLAAGALEPAHVILQQDLAHRGTEERFPAAAADGARQIGFGRVFEGSALAPLSALEHVPFVGVHARA